MALQIARQRARSAALRLRTVALDLEMAPLPAGPWDLVVCVDFLWRTLFDAIPGVLAPGGCLVVVHPTRTNRQRHEHPGPRHLLDDGELPGLVVGLEVIRYEESWTDEGRHEARLVARRPLDVAGSPGPPVP
jgi:SAM-dependent methyltransferase